MGNSGMNSPHLNRETLFVGFNSIGGGAPQNTVIGDTLSTGWDGSVATVGDRNILPGAQFSTPGLTNDDRGVLGELLYSFGQRLRWLMGWTFVGIPGSRTWCGLTAAGSSTNMLASSTPAYSYLAFRYDTNIDTEWMAVVDNGSGKPIATSTGVVPSTTRTQFLEIQSDSDLEFARFLIDGRLVVSMDATKLPALDTLLRHISSCRQFAGGTPVVAQIPVIKILQSVL